MWTLPEQISAPPSKTQTYSPNSIDVATDKAGNITLVWSHELYGINGGVSGPFVSARTKPIESATWTAPIKLSSGLGGGYDPKVSASPDGSLVAVSWVSTYKPYVATYNPALGWAATQKLNPAVVTHYAYQSAVSAGNGGVAAMAWSATDFQRHPNTIIHASSFAP
jgi:hypothetical protein